MKSPLLAFGFLLLAARQDPAAKVASIRGVVVDRDGRPAAHVHVTAEPYGGAWSGPLRGALSEEDGSFSIVSLPTQHEYVLVAWSEERNVPNPMWAIYTPQAYSPVKVRVEPDAVVEGVRVQLGPAVGRLNGTIVDAHTGLPLHAHGQVKLLLKDAPGTQLSKGINAKGVLSMLVPDRPVILEVAADGCDPWRYTDPATREAVLSVAAGQIVQQTIPLNCPAARSQLAIN